jgi:hypothetical protein
MAGATATRCIGPLSESRVRTQNFNGEPRSGIRLVARTIAGAHIREAAAPIMMLLRVISKASTGLLVPSM